MSNENIPAGMKEAKGPELFKFTSKGQELRGIFLRAENVKINGDSVLEVYMHTKRGVVKFRASYDVRSKLSRALLGKDMLVRYIGDDHERGKDGNPLKVYGVYYGEPGGEDDGAPEIGDDDIPF